MLDAASFISTLQKRQGLRLCCPEEIAYGQKWISTEQLQKLAAPSIHTDPIITKLLDKVPANMRASFGPDQMLALKVALYLLMSALGIDLLPGFSLGL